MHSGTSSGRNLEIIRCKWACGRQHNNNNNTTSRLGDNVFTPESLFSSFFLEKNVRRQECLKTNRVSGGWPLPMESWPLFSDTITKLEGRDRGAVQPGERRQNWQQDFTSLLARGLLRELVGNVRKWSMGKSHSLLSSLRLWTSGKPSGGRRHFRLSTFYGAF